ncbi:hypothetical protein CMUS01_05154 [Colletotrichum musicola]|uniref:Myb-like domain-containing protein n=1 Tax=Colletotrichum musicola TaxID=2175873 RepID=A0A8H6NKR6_9PEZI|nr:hypothetical protein CMUS01_05154 [Colletotrichum musicola]
MSDATTTESGEGASTGRVGAWTDAERVQFLLRVLKSAYSDGKGPDWKTISMPGRTTKALQHQWTSVAAQMRNLDIGGDGAAPAKPRASMSASTMLTFNTDFHLAAPKKRATKKTATKSSEGEEGEEANDGEGDDATPKKPTTPRKRGPAKKSAAKVEAEDEVADEVKTEAKVEDNGDEKDEI